MSNTERKIGVRFDGDAKGLDRAAKDGERAISSWERQLDKARSTLGGATRASDEFGQAAEGASKKARTAAESLDRQISSLRGSLHGLAVEFASTGDNGIAKQMRDAEREMRKLTKARNLIGGGDDSDAAAAGVKFGARFSEGLASGLARAGGPISSALSGVFGSMPPQAQAAIGATVVAGIASVAPLVGGVLAGAVVGGVGIGGVVGGMAIAATHVDVQTAAKRTGDSLKEVMQRSAVAFVPATVGALGTVRNEIVGMEGDFKRIFTKAAKFVEPLTRGVTGFLRNLLPGIEDAVTRAGPIIDELAAWGPRLGTLLSDMLSKFSSHANEAASALRMFWAILEFGLRFVGNFVTGLTVAYGWMDKLGALMTGNVGRLIQLHAAEQKAKGGADEHSTSLQSLTDVMGGYGVKVEDAAAKTERLLSGLTQLTGAAQSSRQATMDFEAGLDALTESVKNNGTTMDVTNEKGRANLQVIESLISAADRAGQAAEQRALAEGASAEVAAAAGARMRETFIADLEKAAKAAGFSAQKIAAMVAEVKAADGQRAQIVIETHFKQFGKPYSDVTGIGGSTDRGMATGGRVRGRGTSTSDSNARWLSDDEYVIRARAARAIGYDNLDRLNRTGGGQARSVLAERDYLAGGAGSGGMGAGSAASTAGGGVPEVRVFVGTRELTDIVVEVVDESNRGLKRRVLAGAGVS